MAIAAHIRWLWGTSVMAGGQTTFNTVRSGALYSTLMPVCPCRRASRSFGSRDARSSTARVAGNGSVVASALTHSATRSSGLMESPPAVTVDPARWAEIEAAGRDHPRIVRHLGRERL